MPNHTFNQWDILQYAQFKKERAEPFYDLTALVERVPKMQIVDLGCGTGELTTWLHKTLGASETLGIDVSDAMFNHAGNLNQTGLNFEQAEIASFEPTKKFDLVFSNAALHWIDDHMSLFEKIATWLKPDGQLAIQMPINWEQPSHNIARELAETTPFVESLNGYREPPGTLPLNDYLDLLRNLGFKKTSAKEKIYMHQLESSDDIVEWVKGSLFTPFRKRLKPRLYRQFVGEYRMRIRAEIGDHAPYSFSFRRLFLWGKL